MGLDMYLKLRKSGYESEFRGNVITYPDGMEDIIVGKKSSIKAVTSVMDYDIGYWRKANAIHNWFVNHCANCEDDCRPVYVSKEQLRELYSLCLQVMVDNSKAPMLLPTCDGCFFGTTEYDEDYFDDLSYTVTLLERTLKFLDEHPEDDYDIIYEASW